MSRNRFAGEPRNELGVPEAAAAMRTVDADRTARTRVVESKVWVPLRCRERNATLRAG